MPTRAELVTANEAIRALLSSGAEAELRALPGVNHVSVGLKERGDVVTDTLAIRVYVDEKLPDSQLTRTERIPPIVEGIPTDVLVRRAIEFAAANTHRYRPLVGGSLIGNRIVALNQAGTGTTMEAGTFGCTAKRTSDGSVMLLSNWHVLMANGARKGDPIYQPVPTRIPTLDPAVLPIRLTRDEDVIAKISDSAITGRVDGAIARLDLSSCCRCCGLDYRDEIVGLSEGATPPSNRLVGRRAAVPGSTVFKVGAMTGRTVGRVVDDNTGDLQGTFEGTAYTLSGQIEIESSHASDPFSARGDSGSAIVDEDGFIVGLLFGSTPDAPPAHRTYANHIADVCSELGIEINTDASTSDTAGELVTVPGVPTGEHAEVYAAARARLLSDPAGAWLWQLADRHRHEVVRLVNRSRPVTVAWHRAGGPALFAAALNTLRAGGEELPTTPDGGGLEAPLRRMGAVLGAHGSPPLREAIERHREALLASVRESETVGDVLDKLRGAARLTATSPVEGRGA